MNTERSGEWGSRRQIHVLALMAITALGLYLCSLMVLPFVPALTWALALADALRERTGVDVETQVNDDGILFRFLETDREPPLSLVRDMGPDEARGALDPRDRGVLEEGRVPVVDAVDVGDAPRQMGIAAGRAGVEREPVAGRFVKCVGDVGPEPAVGLRPQDRPVGWRRAQVVDGPGQNRAEPYEDRPGGPRHGSRKRLD